MRRLVLAGLTFVLLLLQLAGVLFTRSFDLSAAMQWSDFPLLPVINMLTMLLMPLLLVCMLLQVCMRTVAFKPGEPDVGPKVVNVFSAILCALWAGLVFCFVASLDKELFANVPNDWETLWPLCIWGAALAPAFTLLFATQLIAQKNTAPWRCGMRRSPALMILFIVFAAIWALALVGRSTFQYTQMNDYKAYLEGRVESLENELDDVRDRDRGYYGYYGRSESAIEDDLDEAQKRLDEFGVTQWNESEFPATITIVGFLLGIALTWGLAKPNIAGAVVCTLGVVIYWISTISYLSLDSVDIGKIFEDNPFRFLLFTDCLYLIPFGWLMYVVRREPWPQAPAA